MRQLSTYELEHIAEALHAAGPSSIHLNAAETQKLLLDVRGEIARRERAAAERNLDPKARPVQYRRDGATVTVYEQPMPAKGVRAPGKRPDGSGVKITSADDLLMRLGSFDHLLEGLD
jgi:hypothetical protein